MSMDVSRIGTLYPNIPPFIHSLSQDLELLLLLSMDGYYVHYCKELIAKIKVSESFW